MAPKKEKAPPVSKPDKSGGGKQKNKDDPPQDQRREAAVTRLKVYEGVPPPYDKIKKMVIPDALNVMSRVLRLQSGHKYCLLGRHRRRWDRTILTLLESWRRRKDRAQTTNERKQQLTKLRVKTEKVAEEKLGAQLDIIAPVKY